MKFTEKVTQTFPILNCSTHLASDDTKWSELNGMIDVAVQLGDEVVNHKIWIVWNAFRAFLHFFWIFIEGVITLWRQCDKVPLADAEFF